MTAEGILLQNNNDETADTFTSLHMTVYGSFCFKQLKEKSWFCYLHCICLQSGKPARWRDFHSATGIGDRMYIFGGRSDRNGPQHTNSEIYCQKIQIFDTAECTWHEPDTVGQTPVGRRSHSACKSSHSALLRLNYRLQYRTAHQSATFSV